MTLFIDPHTLLRKTLQPDSLHILYAFKKKKGKKEREIIKL